MIGGDQHRRISKVTFYGCDDKNPTFVVGLQVNFRNNDVNAVFDPIVTAYHGSHNAADTAFNSIDLDKDEYITELWFTTTRYRHNRWSHRTKIGSMAVTTNKNKTCSCGLAPDSGKICKIQILDFRLLKITRQPYLADPSRSSPPLLGRYS